MTRNVPALTSRRRNNLGFTKLAEEKCPHAVHHNAGNEAQVVRTRVDDVHLEAWNVVTGDLALRDTDVGGMAASKRTQLAVYCCCPVFFLRNLLGGQVLICCIEVL